MNYCIIDLGASGWEYCENNEEEIKRVLDERDRLTEEFGHDKAYVHARGLTRDELNDFLWVERE